MSAVGRHYSEIGLLLEPWVSGRLIVNDYRVGTDLPLVEMMTQGFLDVEQAADDSVPAGDMVDGGD